MARIQFLGAARHVTGSRHLLSVAGGNVLLDCGLVQGPRRLSDVANRELGLHPQQVDAVVLSHAHIDHSGALPRLVKLGYRGAIHCTDATADLLELLLPDSANIQAENAKFLEKHGKPVTPPPYEIADVERTLDQLVRHAYHAPFEVLGGVRCEFLEAGHILGSAIVDLRCDENGRALHVVFTGDLGRRGYPILRDPDPIPPCDVLLTESTYGDRVHEPAADVERALEQAIHDAEARGGRILVPAFSVGRTQNLLYALGRLQRAGRIPEIPIWVDSPLSTRATRVVAAHRELFDKEARRILADGHDPLLVSGLRFVSTPEESKALNFERRGLILSASGMCEAGRILHHLAVSVGREQDLVLAVGFMARGTLGRKLVDGYDTVPILGERYHVRCEVRTVGGMSAHADKNDLLAAIGPLAGKVRRVFVVHGEEDAACHFADALRDVGFAHVDVPVQGQLEEV